MWLTPQGVRVCVEVCVCAFVFEAGRLTPTLPANKRKRGVSWFTDKRLGWDGACVCVGLARTWEAANESLLSVVASHPALLCEHNDTLLVVCVQGLDQMVCKPWLYCKNQATNGASVSGSQRWSWIVRPLRTSIGS